MAVYTIAPTDDPRWDQFVGRHPMGSVFHTSHWLTALRRTYGYIPVALTTSSEGEELSNALVFCDVRSWLTGRRFVSLPFSDYCEPLVENDEQLAALVGELIHRSQACKCRYAELRPTSSVRTTLAELPTSREYICHRLDIRAGARSVYGHLHRDCIQRKVKKAEREGLEIRKGLAPEAIADFHRLVAQTRRRQGLPPQPLSWFLNIAECLGESAVLRMAYKDDRAVAGVFTLEHRNTLYYKYGASDARYHNVGGIPYLLWDAIQDGIARGFEEVDLGRSDLTDAGLIHFKDRWGAERHALTYYSFPGRGLDALPDVLHKKKMIAWTFQHLPESCLVCLGRMLYRHIG